MPEYQIRSLFDPFALFKVSWKETTEQVHADFQNYRISFIKVKIQISADENISLGEFSSVFI